MATLAVTLRTIPVGTVVIGPLAVPVGAHSVSLRLDVVAAAMALGQILIVSLEASDDGGQRWQLLSEVDFTGPGLDRLSLPRTDVTVRTNFGATGIETRVAGERWLVRALVEAQVAAVAITGGELAVV